MTATTPTAPDAARRWRMALSREEIASLKTMEDWRSWLTILVNWGIVFGAMALVAAWPNVFTVVLALFLIGARQLGMAVVMHEAFHGTLLRKRSWNDWVLISWTRASSPPTTA